MAGRLSVFLITVLPQLRTGAYKTTNKYVWKEYGQGRRERRVQWTGQIVPKKDTLTFKGLSLDVSPLGVKKLTPDS